MLSSFLELSNDEVYYITYARQLQFNYFDHPPIIGILIKLFSINLLLKSELFLRLPFIICGAISMWLVFHITKKILDERAAWMACYLFTASLYANIIGGFMIMPDAPMLLCWLWAFYLVVEMMQQPRYLNRNLLLFGCAAGLAVMSKVSGVMLWAGLGIYLLFFDRKVMKSPYLYASILITFIVASPIIIWSYMHGATGASYHAQRISIPAWSSFKPQYFLQQVLGEIGYNNPVNFALIITGIAYCLQHRLIHRRYRHLIICFAWPLVIIVWFSALYNHTLPHWTGPSYTTLLFFAAAFLSHRTSRGKNGRLVILWANAITVVTIVIISCALYFLPVAFNRHHPHELGSGDLLLDFSGWKKFGKDFGMIYKRDTMQETMQPGSLLLSNYWFPAAHIDWYVAAPNHLSVKAIGPLHDIHQYAWLNKNNPLKTGSDAYFVYVSNYYKPPDSSILHSFTKALPVQEMIQYRNNIAVRKLYIIRLKGYKGLLPNNGVLNIVER